LVYRVVFFVWLSCWMHLACASQHCDTSKFFNG
jgi:hypothetical protein